MFQALIFLVKLVTLLLYFQAVRQQKQGCNNDEVLTERNSTYKKANRASASAFRQALKC